MWKVLFSLVVLLAPASALADCVSRVALVQSLVAPVTVEAIGAVQFANDKCPGGFAVGCWPLKDVGDAVMVAQVATLDGWLDEIDVDCTGETDEGILAWKATVVGAVFTAKAQFQYIHDTHVSLVP
tara:strand:- start:125 stop:502 length:378 start_codon:yes stop_codon:yes gene_type:complete